MDKCCYPDCKNECANQEAVVCLDHKDQRQREIKKKLTIKEMQTKLLEIADDRKQQVLPYYNQT